MKLIIAEKPSLARNIAGAIGNMQKNRGFYSGGGYIVTWAFGHLFSLCDIEHYSPVAVNRWTMENLPCFPEKFEYELKKDAAGKEDGGVKERFSVLCELCNRDDVECIINAGDADREGEIIVRTIAKKALKKEKPILRLWLPDQTPETIRSGLEDCRPDSEYDALAAEGYARTFIDWLYGVNLTRFATLKTGTLLRVGRVIVPIVKAIYDRDLEIRSFSAEPYLSVVSKEETGGEKVELVSEKKFTLKEKDKAEKYCAALNAGGAFVVSKKTKKTSLLPGKLYSLTKLQSTLGKRYKMSMDTSLKLLQGLYEKGYVTYPRTNSEYLATAEKEKIKKVIAKVAEMGYPVAFCDKKTIFDDSKIESHSALCPTTKFPKREDLSEDEITVYKTVLSRFVAVFCKNECVCLKSEMKIRCPGGPEDFILRGTVIEEKGWTKFDAPPKGEKILPSLSEKDAVNILFAPKETKPSPPKHYTIETLNNYLKNPFREDMKNADEDENADDTADYRAIFEGLELGTEATRTGIIENAVRSKYIDRKKDVYTILPGGEFLIESLTLMGISMDKYKTSELGQALKKVYHGTIKISDAVEMAKKEVGDIFRPDPDTDTGFYKDIIGKCPVCGKNVIRGKFCYGCEGYRDGCGFKIPVSLCRRAVPITCAKMLLTDGKTPKMTGFTSKNGKKFDSALILEDNRVKFNF